MNNPVADVLSPVQTKAEIRLSADTLAHSFDREPTPFNHTLSELDIFRLPALHRLAEKMNSNQKDYFIAYGAPTAGTGFFNVPMVAGNAADAIEHLDTRPCRILLKRAENHDPDFRDLIHTLFHQVRELAGGLPGEKIVRLESGLLITSSATITPFHYDEEIGFFSQIEGDKIYHVYSPHVVAEQEMERFCLQGGGVLAPLSLEGRNPAFEHVYHLKAGTGFHQPRCAPHWVETRSSRSVSYTFVFETERTRSQGRTRAFNHYLRRMRITPSAVGTHVTLDGIKSGVMQHVIPMRKKVGPALRKFR